MKKYELVNYNEELCLYQIKALKSFNNVEVGDLGGYIASEDILSHNGNCWVSGYANVYGNAIIEKSSDYVVFKNTSTSNRYFTYTFSNDSWSIGCFYGDTNMLKEHLKTRINILQQKNMVYILI